MDKEHFACPVCGYMGLDHPAYSESGCASYDICRCCGTQFGYDDANRSYESLRAQWLVGGAKWWSDARPAPNNWSAVEQLENAGLEVIFPCPCCGYLTFATRGEWDICPVCFWEDDPLQAEDPNYRGGANEESLNEARSNYAKYKVSELRVREYVRDPLPEEIP